MAEKKGWSFDRLATEEEKQRLFDAIKERGYKWNAETKMLGKLIKPKFDPKTLMAFDRVLVRLTKIVFGMRLSSLITIKKLILDAIHV